jgi:hypothetical protein
MLRINLRKIQSVFPEDVLSYHSQPFGKNSTGYKEGETLEKIFFENEPLSGLKPRVSGLLA